MLFYTKFIYYVLFYNILLCRRFGRDALLFLTQYFVGAFREQKKKKKKKQISENVKLNKRKIGTIIFASKRHTHFRIFYVWI